MVTLPNGFSAMADSGRHPGICLCGGATICRHRRGDRTGRRLCSVIDTAANAVVATIPAGQGCSCVGSDGMAVTPDGALVYVANELENSVSVIRPTSNSVIATIPVGTGPIGVAAGSRGRACLRPQWFRDDIGVWRSARRPTRSSRRYRSESFRLGESRWPRTEARLYRVDLRVQQRQGHRYGVEHCRHDGARGTRPMGVDVSAGQCLGVCRERSGNSVSVIDTGHKRRGCNDSRLEIMPYSVRITPTVLAPTSRARRGHVAVINTQTNGVTGDRCQRSGYAMGFTPDGAGRAYVTGENAQNRQHRNQYRNRHNRS